MIGAAAPKAKIAWADSPTTERVACKKRTRVAAPLNIELFEKCKEFTTDSFWIELLEDARTGKFPPKFSYKDGLLQFKNNQKITRQPLSLNPEVACKEFIAFIQDHGGIYSSTDQKIAQERRRERQTRDTSSWSKLSKKEKAQSVSQFVRSQKELYELDDMEVKQLQYILNYGFIMNYFHKGSIKVESYVIQQVDGLEFNQEERKYIIDMSQVKQFKSNNKSKPKVKPNYFDLWCNFHGEIITENMRMDGKIPSNHRMCIKRNGAELQLVQEAMGKKSTTSDKLYTDDE